MKRSIQVTAPLLTAAALSVLTGCRKPEMQRCVDEQNHVVPDNFCQNGQQNLQQNQVRNPNGVGYIPMYRYYYGGYGGYGIGSVATGGGYTGVAGHSYASSTTRGGFGSSMSGEGSGAHGSGGE